MQLFSVLNSRHPQVPVRSVPTRALLNVEEGKERAKRNTVGRKLETRIHGFWGWKKTTGVMRYKDRAGTKIR